jgi:uracil-DNA glycosylase family 4
MAAPGAFLSPAQVAMLDAMDIQAWTRQGAPNLEDVAPPLVAATTGVQAPAVGSPAQLGNWEKLAGEVANCRRCRLHESRRQTVFGVGNTEADWMIIGEAPGADEDRQGEPFVGKAGQLLNEMLRAVGFARNDVYIANILKCRPPGNRDPKVDEAEACAEYLRQQIEWVAPKMILVVGRIAAQNLLQSEEPVGRMRGVVHRLAPLDVPVVVTYHPAYLLRSPEQKRKAWADLCLARSVAA